MIAKRSQPLLGQKLLQLGLISIDELRIGLTEQNNSSQPLGQTLVCLGFIKESELREVLGDVLQHESIDVAALIPDHRALDLCPKQFAQRHKILPITLDSGDQSLTVAMADPFDLAAIDALHSLVDSNIRVHTKLAGATEISAAIGRFYSVESTVDAILNELELPAQHHSDATDIDSSQPIIRLVQQCLIEAVQYGASDIHFEPEANFVAIRYRIDGVLRQLHSLHGRHWPAIAVRIKVMCGLNIAETRAPQDGSMSREVNNKRVDFRVSVLPTLHGENIVVRILDRHKTVMSLDHLGLLPDSAAELERAINKPTGLVLVTGPTGSGKTTTLYSMLNRLNSESVNIMTLEDPVEYPMTRIRQASLNAAIKLDFANGIRSLLRQDPDIILVGEIRDHETAMMVVRAAMTGHKVFSSLHTVSALNAITRLQDLGVATKMLLGVINAIVGQRLLRSLCNHCKTPHEASSQQRELLLMDTKDQRFIYRARGCSRCQWQGYAGRFALIELLICGDEFQDLLANNSCIGTLHEHINNKGHKTIWQNGVSRVLDGSTSLDELLRVVAIHE